MDDLTDMIYSDDLIEILPPEARADGLDQRACLCCCLPCNPSAMDEDGCGICDECLAPSNGITS